MDPETQVIPLDKSNDVQDVQGGQAQAPFREEEEEVHDAELVNAFRKILIWLSALRCTPLRSGGKGVNVVVATLLSLLSKISLEDVS